MDYLPKENCLIFATDSSEGSTIVTEITDINMIQMMDIHFILLFFIRLNGIFE